MKGIIWWKLIQGHNEFRIIITNSLENSSTVVFCLINLYHNKTTSFTRMSFILMVYRRFGSFLTVFVFNFRQTSFRLQTLISSFLCTMYLCNFIYCLAIDIKLFKRYYMIWFYGLKNCNYCSIARNEILFISWCLR